MNPNGRQDKGFWYHQEYDPIRNGSMDGTDIAPHDHGLQRASRCHYNSAKDPSIQSDPYKTLFVGRLRPQTTEDIIKSVFERYGPIQSVHLVRDLITGYSKGYAFVEFKHERDFEAAFYRAHRIRLDDAQILVDYMREQTIPGWVPRRLGGGVGGKRPSGQMRFGGRDCAFRAPFNSTIFNKQGHPPQGQRTFHNTRREIETREEKTQSGRRDYAPQRREDPKQSNSNIHRNTETRPRPRSRSRSHHRHHSRSRSRDRNRSYRHHSRSHDRHSHRHRH